ncbi:hypothetical protein [Agrobacterium burrii]|uniref:Uncharacterized protein n=1 Tax=Agrobacterium burrii TaxID=2815339 RepID=A0ABS3EJW3_9HYPH|nr:hypothetical protein [Agrobacterium burrii]MBO0132221.1 hypothetical protein [Agrobacterium burrii]
MKLTKPAMLEPRLTASGPFSWIDCAGDVAARPNQDRGVHVRGLAARGCGVLRGMAIIVKLINALADTLDDPSVSKGGKT